MASQDGAGASGGTGAAESTQSTQYDRIGTKYKLMHDLPAALPEKPSVVAALGEVTGKRCLDLACGTGRYTALLSSLGASSVHGYDISSAMIDGALASYPPASHPTLHFSVADCSKPENLPSNAPFDFVFAGWFLNYAGTEAELTSMFRVIAQNLAPGGKFIGLTTNAHDSQMKAPKLDFYGLDVVVLEREYVAPDTGVEVGIKAKVVPKVEHPFSFDVFQFRSEVYERCAGKAGLRLEWREPVLPEDDKEREEGFWEGWLQRPTFEVVLARRV